MLPTISLDDSSSACTAKRHPKVSKCLESSSTAPSSFLVWTRRMQVWSRLHGPCLSALLISTRCVLSLFFSTSKRAIEEWLWLMTVPEDFGVSEKTRLTKRQILRQCKAAEVPRHSLRLTNSDAVSASFASFSLRRTQVAKLATRGLVTPTTRTPICEAGAIMILYYRRSNTPLPVPG